MLANPNPALNGPLSIGPQALNSRRHPVHTTLLSKTANLANLLPTGTVLAFQALIPSFSNNGSCHLINEYLTGWLLFCLAVLCFLSSFTDSFLGPKTGKLYYGLATPKGLFVFSELSWDEEKAVDEQDGSSRGQDFFLGKYRVRVIDFVHAFVSVLVLFVFALGDSRVLGCYAGDSAEELGEMLANVPLVVGAFSSFLFVVFPTTRRGIGYADIMSA